MDENIIRVVVVDDHRTLADLLAAALADHPDLHCTGVAYDIAGGLALIDRDVPDVVVMDVQFDGETRDGIDAAAEVAGRHPGTRVVLLTGILRPDLAQRAADAGAAALLPKNGALDEVLTVLRSPESQGLFVHPSLLKTLLTTVPSQRRRAATDLTRRERDVLGLLFLGQDVRSIATDLGISPATCRGYVKSLLVKLGAHSQLEAVAIARRHGLVDDDARA